MDKPVNVPINELGTVTGYCHNDDCQARAISVYLKTNDRAEIIESLTCPLCGKKTRGQLMFTRDY